MISGTTLRIVLIGGAVILTGVVYLLPKNTEKVPASGNQPVTAQQFSFRKYETDSRNVLEWNAAEKLTRWDSLISKNEREFAWYDSIALLWDQHQKPGMAASWFEKKARFTENERDWIDAAFRYFDAFKSGKDSSEVAFFTEKTIGSYTRVLEIAPGNLNAKVDLGVLYAEGTAEPMRGITLLREVVAQDSTHENAQLNLGFLSLKSGQYEKARERFLKVLHINPSRVDMYVYIGESFLRNNQIDEAIRNFELFKNLTGDPQMASEMDEYIKTIKSRGPASN